MEPTQGFDDSMIDRARREPDFARALPEDADALMLNGEPGTARAIPNRILVSGDVAGNVSRLASLRGGKAWQVLKHSDDWSSNDFAGLVDVLRRKTGVRPEVENSIDDCYV